MPFRVVVAVPESEVLFFGRPELFGRAPGGVGEHMLELARLSPRRAIGKLSSGEPYESAWLRIFNALDDAGVEALRETGPIQELPSLIGSAVEPSSCSAVSKA